MKKVYFYRVTTHDREVEVSGYFTTNLCPTRVFGEVKRVSSNELGEKQSEVFILSLNCLGEVE